MITISSDPEMLNTARLAQCEDLQVTKNETRKVWTKRFCDRQRADSAHLQSLARLVFNSAPRTDCIMRARIIASSRHSRHSRHSRSTYFNDFNRMSVFSIAAFFASPYHAIYRYIIITATAAFPAATGDVSSSDPEVHRSLV